MLLDPIFAPFVKERPICVMARAVLERLLDAPRIDDLFARTAQRQSSASSRLRVGVAPTILSSKKRLPVRCQTQN